MYDEGVSTNGASSFRSLLGTHGEHVTILGLYEVLERHTAAFPYFLLESCSGGGGRFDPGMLYYMPQTWTSDNTDAVERLKIQYGTSIVYPISSIGAHVSAEALVAYFQVLSEPNSPLKKLRLNGLNLNHDYLVCDADRPEDGEEMFGGDELMRVGLKLPVWKGDFRSRLYHLRRVDGKTQ